MNTTDLTNTVRCLSLILHYETKPDRTGGKVASFSCALNQCNFHLLFNKDKEGLWLNSDNNLNSINTAGCSHSLFPQICAKCPFFVALISVWKSVANPDELTPKTARRDYQNRDV